MKSGSFTRQSILVALVIFFAIPLLGLSFWYKYVPKETGLAILFLGNSYTSNNSLPTLFQNIADSAGYDRPAVSAYTPGGYSFNLFLADPTAQALIKSGEKQWEVVILQEQSEIPAYSSVNSTLQRSSITAAVGLAQLIKQSNPHARIILFETWARDARLWRTNAVSTEGVGANADEMQTRLRSWYEEAANAMSAAIGEPISIARVGDLWQINYHSAHPLLLHDKDGSHPNPVGSYLAALEIFSEVYRTSLQKVQYQGEITSAEMTSLKNIVTQLYSTP
ncbi:MAG: SGNH/GDSL hydrolase family protein [Chloroflexi bacterium]|uniref:SGNH/GDSL hydrolase family protein n=1 Tax=Candidatus Chlorohelix allophototropha TaxID=3003348 RepID=A0A8T7M7F1_9CHLR|nr:SGNH/GDSL hydrolase family protein [Chloroflexota bacterium]WJW69837.1 hypothetical protein OZ401_003467 [Chloroflexota bacterium L227-S17]